MLTALAIASNAFAQTAQPPIDPATHAAYVVAGTMPADAAKANLTLPEQLAQLQKKNAQLEATLAKMAPASAPMSGMPVAAPASPPVGMDKMKPSMPMPPMVTAEPMPDMGMMDPFGRRSQ